MTVARYKRDDRYKRLMTASCNGDILLDMDDKEEE